MGTPRYPTMLQIKNLSFSYQKKEVIYYNDFDFLPGKTIISGVSGCGKSTFFDLIARTLFPKTGAILWQGVNVNFFDKDFYYRYIFGTVTQNAGLSGYFKLNNYLAILDYIYPDTEKKIPYFIEKLQLKHLLDEPIENCSGGEKYRINLLIILLKGTPLLCLDEPTAHLDEKNKKNVIELLGELEDKVILIITHDPLLLTTGGRNSFVMK